jgi:hypothetical protein
MTAISGDEVGFAKDLSGFHRSLEGGLSEECDAWGNRDLASFLEAMSACDGDGAILQEHRPGLFR